MRIRIELQSVVDAFALAYRAWLKRTGAEPNAAAFVEFHKLPDVPRHDPCNFCHS